MSPLDLSHSRFGPKAGLGVASAWQCPACGKQNDGRAIEAGCGHCGSGDPSKGHAGSARPAQELSAPVVPSPAREQQKAERGAGHAAAPPVQATRILRLIEYLVHPGQDFDPVLRRSLVGRIEMGWGSLTATIVDSCDDRQEDLLGLARKQPGVWLANPDAMDMRQSPTKRAWVRVEPPPLPFPPGPSFTIRKEPSAHMTQPETPDTGPTFTAQQYALAVALINCASTTEAGWKLANTLALALGSIAEELAGNSEPHKFLSSAACLALANALLQQIPDDWQGDGVEPPAPAPSDQIDPAVLESLERVRSGSVPTASAWVDPTTRPGVL